MSHRHRPLGIEIGGADQQNPALDPLSGDVPQKRLVDIFLDQPRQRRVVGQSRSFEQTGYVVGENVLPSIFREDLTQLAIISAPEEREGSNQRAGADAGDQIERRPGPRVAPADQQAGAEGAVIRTAGDGEEIGGRPAFQPAGTRVLPPLDPSAVMIAWISRAGASPQKRIL